MIRGQSKTRNVYRQRAKRTGFEFCGSKTLRSGNMAYREIRWLQQPGAKRQTPRSLRRLDASLLYRQPFAIRRPRTHVFLRLAALIFSIGFLHVLHPLDWDRMHSCSVEQPATDTGKNPSDRTSRTEIFWDSARRTVVP